MRNLKFASDIVIMLIGNTILGLAKLLSFGHKDTYAKKMSTPSIISMLMQLTAKKGQVSPLQKIQLHDLNNPAMPFKAWFLDNFIRTNIANSNTLARTSSNFIEIETQRKLDAKNNITPIR